MRTQEHHTNCFKLNIGSVCRSQGLKCVKFEWSIITKGNGIKGVLDFCMPLGLVVVVPWYTIYLHMDDFHPNQRPHFSVCKPHVSRL